MTLIQIFYLMLKIFLNEIWSFKGIFFIENHQNCLIVYVIDIGKQETENNFIAQGKLKIS